MPLVTGGLIVLVKIRKIKTKYFDIIKSFYMHKFNKQGFKKTRFLIRKRKLLDTHRKILKTGMFFVVNLNLRHAPFKQVQYSN